MPVGWKMDTFDCIATKLDVREFDKKTVPAEVRLKILEAARLTGSGNNKQHWRFILVHTTASLKTLAEDSTSGSWVRNANFAVIVLTEERYGFHLIDAGRAAQDMMLTAWNSGVVSCIYTGVSAEKLRKDFLIPKELKPSVVVGFGYPAKKLKGKKDRKPISEIAFLEKFGEKLDNRTVAGS
jgi:nitroreductase